MSFFKDYQNTKNISVSKTEHKVADFPIVQVYEKVGSNFELIYPDISVNTSDLKITISFSKNASNIRVIIK